MELLLSHPPIVHFAIVLPLVAVLFYIYSMISKNEAYTSITTVLLFLATLSVVAAMYTGNIAGPDVYPSLSIEGKNDLLAHKQYGLYLAIFFAVTLVLKVMMKNWRNLIAVLLVVGALGIMYQGKLGGELVYQHAAGVDCPVDDFGEDDDE